MSWKLTFVVAVSIVAVAGVAVAASGGSKSVTLCAAKGDGALSLADAKKCGKGEKKLTIAKQGPQGVAGAPGAPGSPGTTASIQPEAVQAVAPYSGTSCSAKPGTFCSGGPEWTNYGPPTAAVGFWKDAAGEVHLRGTIDSTGGAGVIPNDFFYLPVGFRPVGDRLYTLPNHCEADPVKVEIQSSGVVRVPTFAPNTCVSFDGVSFRP